MRSTWVWIPLLACFAVGQEHDGRADEGAVTPTERAVEAGLAWIAKSQRDDGGWAADGKSAVAPTGLALLAFLGAGYTDRGTPWENTYARTVRAGLAFLKGHQAPKGKLSDRIRDHAIATLTLTEAFWMTRNPRYREPAQRAVAWLESKRQPAGAWEDPLTTGWSVHAVKSAKWANLATDAAVFVDVPKWLDARTDEETGAVGATQRDTAIGVLSRIFLGEDPRLSLAVQRGAKFCVQHLPRADDVDALYLYFGRTALFQVGGTSWKKWDPLTKRIVIGSQEEDGSWKPTGQLAETYGRVGETALMAMLLEVCWRWSQVIDRRR